MNPELLKLVRSTGVSLQMDWVTLAAVIMTESGGDPWAVRYEPKWKYFADVEKHAKANRITADTEKVLQACSWGVGQIMGGVARELGFDGPLPRLCETTQGLFWSAKKLSLLLKIYPNTWDGVSAYNQGNARKGPEGFYVNRAYVEKVQASRKTFVQN